MVIFLKNPVAVPVRACYGEGMATGDSFRTVAGETLGVREALGYLGRAARLKCPVCGTRPIFLPLKRVRSLDDWFSPLDGCPRCGYPYEREPGYFLMAIFGFNLGAAVFVGITVFSILAASGRIEEMSTWELMAKTVLPIPFLNLLIARHCKAVFLALDHFVDPHRRNLDDGSDDDDDDGLGLLPAGPSGGSDGINPDDDEGGGVPYQDKESVEAEAGRETVLTHSKGKSFP